MALVVTGLSQDGDTRTLREALVAAGFSLDSLQVICPTDSDENLSGGTIDANLLVTDPGTTVPGINDGGGRGAFFRNESLADRLGDLGVPESELDNYVEALERGKTVVAYFAHPETIDKAADVFRGANLANVRQY